MISTAMIAPHRRHFLQLTLIGWIPAALWAVYALSQYSTAKQIEQATGRSV